MLSVWRVLRSCMRFKTMGLAPVSVIRRRCNAFASCRSCTPTSRTSSTRSVCRSCRPTSSTSLPKRWSCRSRSGSQRRLKRADTNPFVSDARPAAPSARSHCPGNRGGRAIRRPHRRPAPAPPGDAGRGTGGHQPPGWPDHQGRQPGQAGRGSPGW